MTNADKVAVIYNPHARQGRVGRRWAQIDRDLRTHIGQFECWRTAAPEHATELTRAALRAGFSRIVSVGGDGTHHEVANGFFDDGLPINPDAVMAILPCGTGSDLPRSLGLPRDYRAALPHVTSDRIMRADLGMVRCTLDDGSETMRYFQNTCRVGMGAEVVYRANRTPKRLGGFLTFLWATVRTLIGHRDKPMTIDIDGKVFEQLTKELIVAKGQYDGGGMHIAPYARLDNGAFDVYIIGKIALWDALINLQKLYTGRMTDRPDVVKYLCGKSITVTSSKPVRVQVDGENPGFLPASIQVLPRGINMVVGEITQPVPAASVQPQPRAVTS